MMKRPTYAIPQTAWAHLGWRDWPRRTPQDTPLFRLVQESPERWALTAELTTKPGRA